MTSVYGISLDGTAMICLSTTKVYGAYTQMLWIWVYGNNLWMPLEYNTTHNSFTHSAGRFRSVTHRTYFFGCCFIRRPNRSRKYYMLLLSSAGNKSVFVRFLLQIQGHVPFRPYLWSVNWLNRNIQARAAWLFCSKPGC